MLEISKDVIKFESVTREDEGCYVCEADNGFAEEPVTSKVILVVECKLQYLAHLRLNWMCFRSTKFSHTENRGFH